MYIDITGDSWIDLNTLSTIPVGTKCKILNCGTAPLLIRENSLMPEDGDGVTITTTNHGYAQVNISDGSERLWIKLKRGAKYPTYLLIEEVA